MGLQNVLRGPIRWHLSRDLEDIQDGTKFKHKKLNHKIFQILFLQILPLSCIHNLGECGIQSLESYARGHLPQPPLCLCEKVATSCPFWIPTSPKWELTLSQRLSGRIFCCLSASHLLLPMREVMDLVSKRENLSFTGPVSPVLSGSTSQTWMCIRISWGILVQCQLWSSGLCWGLWFCISRKLSGNAEAVGLRIVLWVTRVCRVWELQSFMLRSIAAAPALLTCRA